jgi:metal transporter CNNM
VHGSGFVGHPSCVQNVFMLHCDAVLNSKKIGEIIQTGYTRIPVYETDRNNVVSLLNVKDLALLDPDDNFTVRTLCSYYEHPVRFVMEDTPLKMMLDEFRKVRGVRMRIRHT